MKNLISVILMVFLPLTLASDTQLRFKVYVSVSGDNETITTILTSHLKRELRALEDVDIVGIDDDWTYVIGVTYVEGELKGGVKTGQLSFAYDMAIRVPKFFFNDAFQDTVAVEYSHSRLGVSIWDKDNLQEWCLSVAGSFNDLYLEIARSLSRKWKE